MIAFCRILLNLVNILRVPVKAEKTRLTTGWNLQETLSVFWMSDSADLLFFIVAVQKYSFVEKTIYLQMVQYYCE